MEIIFYTPVCLLVLMSFGQLKVYSQLLVSCPDYSVSFHGSCYIFGFGNKTSFHGAETFCRDHHNSHFVHVDSKNESTFLKTYMSHLPRSENYWVGMSYENNEWRWTDSDSVVTEFDWAPGEPNNYHGGHACASFWNSHGYQWADTFCEMAWAEPVCELRVSKRTKSRHAPACKEQS